MSATVDAGPRRLPDARQQSELEALRARIAVLERAVADVQATLAATAPSAPDPVRDVRRLSALARCFGGAVFAGADVFEMAVHDGELRAAVQGVSARELGAWCRRVRRCPVGAYVLRRVGRDDRGVVWALDVSPDIHAGARRPCGAGVTLRP